jgi:hypothetical protein
MVRPPKSASVEIGAGPASLALTSVAAGILSPTLMVIMLSFVP